jgi:glucosamine-6-phosphate deaminase
MKIIIRKNYDEMSAAAADIVAALVRSKPDCALGLPAGSTPIGTYRELVRRHREGLDFSRVSVFTLDEYLGVGMDPDVPYDKDQSYARFLHEELIRHINVNRENIHCMDGRAKDPEKFCGWYEDKIKECGGLDLILLGIGRDGHWAFNEPGSSLSSRTRLQPLAAQTLDDNYEMFYKKAGISREQMPRSALTIGIGTILEARHTVMIASGAKKARVIADALEGPVTDRITASAIQLHGGESTVILDEDAAAFLKHKASGGGVATE